MDLGRAELQELRELLWIKACYMCAACRVLSSDSELIFDSRMKVAKFAFLFD
jgi:hypothetical protein